jgi:hypothetical protein
MQEEKVLNQLELAVRKIASNADAVSGAHCLYWNCLSAKVEVATKRKKGTSPQASVAKQLKQIASAADTLAKRLDAADGNVFNAWAIAGFDDSLTEMAMRPALVTQWGNLRNLLARRGRERSKPARLLSWF